MATGTESLPRDHVLTASSPSPAKPTLADVARLAGVSVATASRALNGHPTVARDRARRVRSAADALGYIADATARTVSGGLSSVVALVLCSDSPVPMSLISGAVAAAATHDLAVLISELGSTDDDPAGAVRRIRSHRPRALVLVGDVAALDARTRAELATYRAHGGEIFAVMPPSPPADGDARSWRKVGHEAIRHVVEQTPRALTWRRC